jgi:hypothetical protein
MKACAETTHAFCQTMILALRRQVAARCPGALTAGGGHGGAAVGAYGLAGIAHRRLSVEEMADLVAAQGLVFEQAASQSLGFVRLLGQDAPGIVEPVLDQAAEQIHHDPSLATNVGVFTALLEAIVNRGADVLEEPRGELDQISRKVFRGNPSHRSHTVRSTDTLRKTLSAVGAIGERVSQARDVLLGVGRIASFARDIGEEWITPEFRVQLRAVLKDVASLNELRGASLGQGALPARCGAGLHHDRAERPVQGADHRRGGGDPPMLIAGLYGMNFKFMPELDRTWGYPFGLALILVSALIPLIWFKWRGWF